MVNNSLSYPRKPEQAFTLVELAIVLVIVGIIAGGILAGRDLIRSTELKGIVEERGRFSAAVTQFRERFGALPGDYRKATELWSAQNATHAICIGTASPAQATCNGNGDGHIGEAGQEYERFRVWQHLANAGLIEGHFNGTDELPVPPSGAGQWGLYWLGTWTANTILFEGAYDHALILADTPTDYDSGGYAYEKAYLTSEEMWSLDEKFDDAAPAQGNILASLSPCVLKADLSGQAQSGDADAVYALSTGSIMNCHFIQRDFVGR